MPTFLSVDPSINSLGWATATPNSLPSSAGDYTWNSFDWKCGTFTPQGINLESKLYSIGKFLNRIYSIEELVIEWPTFFNSEKGRIAARAGYTVQLGAICGYIIGFFNLSPLHIHLYTPQQWKGNAPKRATSVKFIRTFPDQKNRLRLLGHDEIDAIMLLHHHFTKVEIFPPGPGLPASLNQRKK
jgi:hypothetical protein